MESTTLFQISILRELILLNSGSYSFPKKVKILALTPNNQSIKKLLTLRHLKKIVSYKSGLLENTNISTSVSFIGTYELSRSEVMLNIMKYTKTKMKI